MLQTKQRTAYTAKTTTTEIGGPPGAARRRARKNTRDLEFSNTGTEVLAISKNPEPRARKIQTRQGQGIPTPIELNTLLLQSKEGNQRADGDGAREGRGCDAESRGRSQIKEEPTPISEMHSLVVLGPPSKEPPLDVIVEDERQRNPGPGVG